MPGLRALHSLRQWRISAPTIEFRADVEQRTMDRAFTVFALLLALQKLDSLMVLKCHGSLAKTIHESIVSGYL